MYATHDGRNAKRALPAENGSLTFVSSLRLTKKIGGANATVGNPDTLQNMTDEYGSDPREMLVDPTLRRLGKALRDRAAATEKLPGNLADLVRRLEEIERLNKSKKK